jgi:mevalonate kinase
MAARQPVKQETSGRNIGFGKVILFGEHVVVHGAAAIVAGVSQYTECKLRVVPGKPGLHVIDNRPAVPGYIVEKRAEQKLAHDLVLKHLNIDTSKDGLEMIIGGPLVPSSGIGASASDVVALSRALNELYNLKLSEDQINHSAFVGEGGYHGTPSGVDNTAATFGGLLTYQKTPQGPKFTKMQCAKTLYLVVIGTGITASTTKVVGEVGAMKEKEPKKFAKIMEDYNVIFTQAQQAIAEGNLKKLGELLNQNHEICQRLTVSCKELEAIVNVSRKAGAVGAKMSGTGRGGIAIALCQDEKQQKKVAEALKQQCPEAKFIWQYQVQGEGKAPKSKL